MKTKTSGASRACFTTSTMKSIPHRMNTRWSESESLKKSVIEALLHAIKAHAPYLGVARESLLDKTLFACDELTGFIVAVALMRPSKSVSDLKVSSVTKKLKQAGFARAVSRSDIQQGAEELGVELNGHIAFVIDAMKKISDRLGL